MKTEILTPVKNVWLPRGRQQLIAPFSFRSAELQMVVTVLAGFIFDESVPRRIPILFALFGYRSPEGGAGHDWLYDINCPIKCTRLQADNVYLELMDLTRLADVPGEPPLKPWQRVLRKGENRCKWLGVRLFGWTKWKKEKKR